MRLWLIPWAMIWLRVVLCPVIVFGAWRGWDGRWLGAIVLVALVNDVLDGVLARRWSCDTPGLRLADSGADTVFYVGVAAALLLRERDVMLQNGGLLVALAVLEVARHTFDLWKFGKAASYHSYLAKVWGLVMGTAVIALLSLGGPRWLVGASVVVGIVANCEGLTMSLMLPKWQNDVKTLWAAWRLRAAMLTAPSRRNESSG